KYGLVYIRVLQCVVLFLMVIAYIAIFLFLCYSALIIFYWLAWRSTQEFFSRPNKLTTSVSVIVPARNEEKNIAGLLQALQQQTYRRDLVQVIVVNDQSTDNTARIAKGFH